MYIYDSNKKKKSTQNKNRLQTYVNEAKLCYKKYNIYYNVYMYKL
jgi:hypothetical protein